MQFVIQLVYYKDIKMNLTHQMLTAAAVLVSSSAVFATDLSTQTGQELGVTLSRYSLDREYIGAIAYDDGAGDSYSGSGVLKNDKDSNKVGLEYTMAMAFENNWFFKLNGKLAYSSSGDTTDLNGDARILVGKDYPLGQFALSPYSGLGYRYIHTDDDYGFLDIKRKTGLVYLPLGLSHRFGIDESSLLETTLEYDVIFSGKQKNKLSVDYIGSAEDSYNRNTGYGIRFSSMYRTNDLAFGPFIDYWNIGKGKISVDGYSDDSAYAVVAYQEKETKNLEFGIKASMRF